MVSKGSNNTSSYSSYARLLGSEMDNRGPTLHFTNINDIQAAVNNFVNKDQNLDTWITVIYLPYNCFEELTSEDTNLCYLKITYFYKEELALLKMASAPYRTAANHITDAISAKIAEAGVKEDISLRSAVKSDIGNATKVSDAAWGPRHKIYATLVVEIAVSETGPHLAASTHLWLEAKDSHVKQAIAINIDRNKPYIRLELWERRRNGRDGEAPSSHRTDEVVAVLDEGRRRVTGALAISFKKLLERDPVPENGEPPFFILTKADIEDIAVRIWQDQGFLPLAR
jgi:hypothetical protein